MKDCFMKKESVLKNQLQFICGSDIIKHINNSYVIDLIKNIRIQFLDITMTYIPSKGRWFILKVSSINDDEDNNQISCAFDIVEVLQDMLILINESKRKRKKDKVDHDYIRNLESSQKKRKID